MSQVISVFVLVLVVSILAGLCFLFVSELKEQVRNTADRTSITTHDESGVYVNDTGYTLSNSSAAVYYDFYLTAIDIFNETKELEDANYSYTTAGVITNASACGIGGNGWECSYLWTANYTFSYIPDPTAYDAVNQTESAGATIVDYLPLIFIALIFGAILTLVLRIILPYINLGQRFGGF